MDAHYLKKEELVNVEEMLKEMSIEKSKELLEFCVYAGGCIGVYEGESLVAVILTYVYIDLFSKHPELIDEALGTAKLPNGKLLTSEEPVLAILGVYVKPEFRGKNFGGILIDNITVNQAHYSLVGIMDDNRYKNVLLERNFSLTELSNGQILFELEARENEV